MNDDLIQRLLLAESDFLTAFESGTQKLASYNETWSALPDILHRASKTGSIDNETLYLAHSVASRIANLASCFLDIRRGEDSSTASLQGDCDALLHRMVALDLNANSKSLHLDNRNDTHYSRSYCSTPVPNATNPSPFLAAAHQWLVDNLHNPYPAAEVKARIAAASSRQVSSINSWFINARRRIGWTALCRERFSNCRADMIDAAYRALVEEDPQRTLSPELRHSFIAMKVAAEGLYPSTFTRSVLAGDLDAVVKDMTDENKEPIEVRKCRQSAKPNFMKTIQGSYPSPGRSTAASPVPALDDSVTDESEEEDVVPPTIAGSKRRWSSIEPVDQLSSVRRPIKRLRTMSRTHLPSPPSSTDGVEPPSDDCSLEISPADPTQPEINNLPPPRKRRVLDVGANGIPKRSHGLTAPPRLHVVSDSLPRPGMENEYSIDDWFKTNFDALFAIPPPVDVTEPDLSTSWDVELFRDYNIPRNPKHVMECPPPPAADTQISAPTDLSDFDNLLRSIGGDMFVAPPENASLSYVTGAPYVASFDSSIPGMLQASTDWTSLLDSSVTYQPINYSTYPQHPADSQTLSEIDLSVPRRPRIMPTVNTQGEFSSQQAKLRQLHVMQEAVWRMEQELQAEGVVV